MIVRYQGHSLTARERFQAERIALNLGERDSTATLTLSDAAPTLSVDEWISWESGPGAGIVWRVKTIDDQVEKKTRTVTVEHTIQTLRDRVLFGEITPKIISGGNSNPTARQTVVYILNQQSDWALGDIAYNVTNPYNFNGDDLFSALETVSSSLADCIWEYDFSTYPFKLYIRQMDSTVTSEMRTDRNIRTLKKTIDRSRMFTRFYPIGKNNLHINGDYVSRNENLYGTVSKVETDQSLTTKEQLTAWANERLSRHAEPAVTVTISGLELTEATGDPLDSFKIGKICRVPLPEFSTQITERVTKLSYPDVIASPMEVTVTLANELQDVAKILKEQAASGKKSNLTHAKESEEDHAWMVDTEDHIGLVAEAVAGEGADKDWSMVASVMVDGQGIHQRVTTAEGEIVSQWTAIEMTKTSIYLEVANAKSDTYSHIEQTASGIRLDVWAAKSTLFSSIMQTSTNIYTQVGNAKSDTYSKIEETASSIRSDVWAAKSTLFSSIMQTATNIYTQVGNAKSDTYSKIEETASSIRSAVWAAKSTLFSSIMQTATNIYTQVGNAKSDTYSMIEQTASSIESSVSSAKSSLWTSIMQTSTEISLKVSKDGVISSINQTAEAITIQASKINLSGYVQASDIDATFISGVLANTSVLSTTYAFSTTFECDNFTQDDFDCYVPNAIWALQLVQTGNDYTLQQKHFYSEDWSNVGTFSRATSLSGRWSGNVAGGKSYRVSASPQGNTCTSPQLDTIYSSGSKTWANDYKSFTQKIKVMDEDGEDLYEEVLSFSTTASYEAGHDEGYDEGYDDGQESITVTDISIWYADGSSEVGDTSISTALSIKPWCKRAGTWMAGNEITITPNHAPTIDTVWTSDSIPSGATQLDSIKTQYNRAKADSDNFCIRVKCGGQTKTYYCTP